MSNRSEAGAAAGVSQHSPWTTLEGAFARLAAGFGTTVLFVVAIVGGSLLGQLSPATGAALGGYVDHTVLLLIGLLFFEVRFPAMARSGSNIRFLSIAWITNFVLVPAIGFGIATLFLSGRPLFFIGLVIYFMAPCADWFLGFTGSPP